jgi:hypothetical protein
VISPRVKYRELFHKFACPMRIFACPVLILAILLPVEPAWSQQRLSRAAPADTTFSHYDSIQDSRLERIRQGTLFRLDRLSDSQEALGIMVDSMVLIQDSLERRLDSVKNDYRELTGQYSLLREQMEQADATTTLYRERMRRILWLGGTLMLLVILGLALYLFLYLRRTRKRLAGQISSVRTETGMAVRKVRRKQKKLEKKTGKEIKKRIRAMKGRG